MTVRRHLVVIVLAACLFAAPAAAQETRAELQAMQEAAKARTLTAQAFSKWEQRFVRLKDGFIEPQGFAAAFGSIYTGSWLALGPSYRRILNEETTLFARGMYSARGYGLAETSVTSVGLADGRVDLLLNARWLDAKDVPFYGLGADTDKDAQTNFRFQETSAGATITVRPAKYAVLSGGFGYDAYDTNGARAARRRSRSVSTTSRRPGSAPTRGSYGRVSAPESIGGRRPATVAAAASTASIWTASAIPPARTTSISSS